VKKFSVLLKKEILQTFRNPATLLFFVFSSLLFGSSFVASLSLYSTASVKALTDSIYARGFEPVLGIFLPSFGGLFLVFSIILPFAVIPALSLEKKHNTLTVLFQLGYSPFKIVSSKFLSSFFVVAVSLFIPLSGAAIFYLLGGHIPFKEFFLLFFGYFLYSLTVVAISLFAGAIFNSVSSSSVVALVLILYSWIVDFLSGVSNSAVLNFLSSFTLTSLLKDFESGILNLRSVFIFVLIIFFFLFLTFVVLSPEKRLRKVFVFALMLFPVCFFVFNFSKRIDFTESLRNSFPPQIAEKIRKIQNLSIKIYLNKEDSRFYDYKKEFLDRVILVNPDIKVEFAKGKQLEENYGIFVYCVGKGKEKKCEKTYSNSPEEAFIILSKLSGMSVPIDFSGDFPGYPLTVKKTVLGNLKIFYYAFFPILFFLFYLFMLGRKKL